MAQAATQINLFFNRFPILKGMVTYAVLWPTSNLCQQAIEGKRQLDFQKAARFSIFGTFVVAPSLYAWVKFAGWLVPGNSFRVAITKAAVEQALYSPYSISMFYGGMTLLEGGSLEKAKAEIKEKFIPTYKMGICVWPIVQTINFKYVKERNRVSVTSVVSFFWTVFLSYMKYKDDQPVDSI